MITEAVGAFANHWANTPALSGLCSDGRLHADEAPPRTKLPYAVAVNVAGPSEDLTEGSGYTRLQVVQVSYFAATRGAVTEAAEAIRTNLRLSDLVIGGRIVTSIFVDGATFGKDPGHGPNGETIYQASIDFEVTWPATLG